MNFDQMINYMPLVLLLGFLLWRFQKFSSTKKKIPSLLSEGALIVDVRSPEEFRAGSNPQSVNIPLGTLDAHIDKLDKKKPVILCCASGARSGMAAQVLKRKGFESVHNAGPWTNTLQRS